MAFLPSISHCFLPDVCYNLNIRRKVMKKANGKYDLIKIIGILVLLTVALTWVVPYGYFQGELVTKDITRVGVINFFDFSLRGMLYFGALVMFLFVLGGFYQVLSKMAGYQNLIRGICREFKDHEVPLVVAISTVLAIFTSVSTEYYAFIVIIPFIITILNRLKVDKISAFSATFGGILAGIIGSTYSTKVSGQFANIFTTNAAIPNNSYIWARAIILLIAIVLLNIFTVLRLKKTQKSKDFQEYDRFEIDSTVSNKDKAPAWPYVTMFILLFVTTVLAYMPWTTMWNIGLFTNITNWVNELKLFGVPIVSYVSGNFVEFGKWNIFTIQFVMIFATMLIHWFGNMSLDDVFESYGEGFKKISYLVVVLLFVYAILEFAVMYPVVPVMVDKIAGLSKNFNIVLSFISGLVAALFSVEPQYMVSLAGTYFAATYSQNLDILIIIFQTAFGLLSFIAPSSAILMLGLAYLEIPYKEWIKHIWKFLLAMFIVVVIVLAIMQLSVL